MIIASVNHPMEVTDLQSVYLKPQIEVVHAAREAHFAAGAAADLAKTSKVAVVKGLSEQMSGAAKAVEFSARKLGCRLNMQVDASIPHLPVIASMGTDLAVMCAANRRLFSEFI